jgi:hypothetical protein
MDLEPDKKYIATFNFPNAQVVSDPVDADKIRYWQDCVRCKWPLVVDTQYRLANVNPDMVTYLDVRENTPF